jgi:uncharacterized membrane protein YvlD (DUF360 family)
MRLLFQVLSQLVLAAIALIIVNLWIPGVEVSLGGFFVAVGVFTLAQAVLSPFVMKMAMRYAAPLTGGVGLVATLLALWVTTLFEGGIEISGGLAWVLTMITVWVITALGGWIILALVIDKWLKRRSVKKIINKAGG